MARSKGRFLAALASGIGVSLGVLACNSLLGIDEYTPVECTGLSCTDGQAPTDAPSGDGDADAKPPDPGPGANPVSWARWVMPNYVLDAGSPPNAPMLKMSGADISDETTQLVWRSRLENAGAPSTLSDAVKACRDIDGAGGWRVPKRIELVTLLDYGHKRPFIDTKHFVDFPDVRVWSSSEVRPLGPDQRYWIVDFSLGAVEQRLGTETAATLCVKAK